MFAAAVCVLLIFIVISTFTGSSSKTSPVHTPTNRLDYLFDPKCTSGIIENTACWMLDFCIWLTCRRSRRPWRRNCISSSTVDHVTTHKWTLSLKVSHSLTFTMHSLGSKTWHTPTEEFVHNLLTLHVFSAHIKQLIWNASHIDPWLWKCVYC